MGWQQNPVVRVFINPFFQVWLNLGAGIIAIILTILAPMLHLLSSVEYVSWLSQLALIYGALGGISASLVYLNARTGETMNKADWKRIDERFERIEQLIKDSR